MRYLYQHKKTPSTLGNAPAVGERQQAKSWWENALKYEPVYKRASISGQEMNAGPVSPVVSNINDRPKIGFAAIRDARQASARPTVQKRSVPSTTSNNSRWTTTGTTGGNYSYSYTK